MDRLFEILKFQMPKHKFLLMRIHVALALFVVLGRPVHCKLRPHPTIPGRYKDDMSVNVLAGNDAIFNYSYPSDVLPIHYITVDKRGGGLLGHCSTESLTLTGSCNRSTQYVRFVSDNVTTYIVIPSVTVSHTGEYIIRVTRKDYKPTDPNLIDLTVEMTVFESEMLRAGFKVPNVFEPEYFSPLEDPYISNVTSIFEVGRQYTVSLLFHVNAPPANATITQLIGNQARTFSRADIRESWSPVIVFNTSKGLDDWVVRIIVKFDIQQVGEATAEFKVDQERLDSGSLEAGHIAAITIGSIVALTAIVAGVLILVLKQPPSTLRYEHLTDMKKLSKLYNTEPGRLMVPEYVYEIDVRKFSSTSSIYQQRIEDCFKITIALANTSGGIVMCRMQDHKKKEWIQKCRSYFAQHSPVKFDELAKRSMKRDIVVFFVKKSFRLIFLHRGLDLQQYDTSITDEQVIEYYPKLRPPQRSYNRMLARMGRLRWKHSPDLYEYIYRNTHLDILENDRKLKQIVESYAGSEEGGTVVFVISSTGEQNNGMSDEYRRRVGEILKSLYKAALADKDPDPFKSWHCRYIEHAGSHVVLWFINGRPIVYGISEKGDIERLSVETVDRRAQQFQQRKAPVLDKDKKEHDVINMDGDPIDSVVELCPLLGGVRYAAAIYDKALAGSSDTCIVRETSPSEDRPRNQWYRRPEMLAATKHALQDHVLSWSINSFAWESGQGIDKKTTKFELTSPLNFVPSVHTIVSFALPEERANLQAHLEKIRKKCKGKGCVIYLQTFAGSIELLLLRENVDPEIMYLASPNSKVGNGWYHRCRILKKKICEKLEQSEAIDESDDLFTFVVNVRNLEDLNDSCSWVQNGDDWIKEQHQKHMSLRRGMPDSLNKAVYDLVVHRNVAVKYRLGDEVLTHCAMDAFSHVLEKTEMFYFIEGPPGSGKSLMAHAVYKREDRKSKVLYCCPTECFRALLKSNGIVHTFCIPDQNTLATMHIHTNEFSVIIIDDMQRIDVTDMKVWKELFIRIAREGKKLYVFTDPKYQNYYSPSNVEKVKSTMIEVCADMKVSMHIEKLEAVYRNSKKIFSFMKENLEKTADNLTCPHEEFGDDVLVCHLRNTTDNSESNGLLQLVKGLMGLKVEGRAYEHDVSYSAAEIAILVGGDYPEDDKKFLMKLFQDHLEQAAVQDARSYPVTGLIVETAEDFCGLDSLVCIYYPGTKPSTAPNVDDKAYKTFIVSRGINLVIFVETASELSLKHADKMQMGNLGKNIIDTYSHWLHGNVVVTLQCIQHAVDDEDILSSLSAITAHYGDKEAAKLFVGNNGIHISIHRVKTSTNMAIKERALVSLTAVAVHEETLPELMNNEVLHAACDSLSSEWDPEWWEAAYLLGHLLHRGGTKWERSKPTKQEVESKLGKCLAKRDDKWIEQRESAVAHGAIDYGTYKKWLQQQDHPVLHLLSMSSLCNLVFSEGDNECPHLQEYIGIETITQISEDTAYDENIRHLASDIVKAFYKKKIVHGKWKRYY